MGGNDTLNGGTGLGKLAFGKAIFTGLGVIGGLTADASHTSTSARDATHRVIYGAATGNLYYDADGTGSRAQVLVATIGDTVYSARPSMTS